MAHLPAGILFTDLQRKDTGMKDNLRLPLLVVLTLALSLTALPARADDDPPPPDAMADAFTLRRVADIASGATSSVPAFLTPFGGDLYFAANAATGFGSELHRISNPSPIDIYPGGTGSQPANLVVYNGALFFCADGGDGAGRELWKYDTLNGAVRVVDLYPGPNGSGTVGLTVYNNALYFSATGDANGQELWKYTEADGAQRVTDVNAGASNASIFQMAVYNNELYFGASGTNGLGNELWKYNPTDGAQFVQEIYPGPGGSWPYYLTVFNQKLYFQAGSNDAAGVELWSYDPVNGVQLAADINPDTNSNPSFLRVYNGALYFAANGGDNAGNELWKFDPVNGADRVADLFVGPDSSSPVYLAVFNGALYFGANGNDGTGVELWKYDNTTTARFRPAKTYEGWVLESTETSNTGGTLNNNSPVFYLGDDNQDRQYRSILSFDTASLPDNAVVIGATLQIRRQGITGTNPFATHGSLLIDIIKGAFSGSNSLQTSDFQAAPSKPGIGTIKNLPDVDLWYTGKFIKTAFPYFNKTGVTQLRLRFSKDDNDDNGADFLRFYSADTANFTDYPVLEVQYYIP
jgi:ELWxxDGT repeat protein